MFGPKLIEVVVQFLHGDGNLTYQTCRWQRIPNVGETIHIMDANSREYISGGPWWTVDEITWHTDTSRYPSVHARPKR